MNSASLLLDKFTNGRGSLSYNEFITNVIGLQPDALRESAGSNVPATHEIIGKLTGGMKETLFDTKGTRDRVFQIFDRDGGGSISLAEFRDGIEKMGLPVNKKQVEQLFHQFDSGQSGSLNMVSFTKDLLGMAGQKAVTPKSMPTSRGGAPRMPKEFMMKEAPRPKTSLDENAPTMDFLSASQRSLSTEPLQTATPIKSRRSASRSSRHSKSSRLPSPIPNPSSRLPWSHPSKGPETPLLAGHSSPLARTVRSASSVWSPVPSHRVKNMCPKLGGKYVGNFFVSDNGLDTTKLMSQREKKSKTPPVMQSKHHILSDQTLLPHFQLSATLGRSEMVNIE